PEDARSQVARSWAGGQRPVVGDRRLERAAAGPDVPGDDSIDQQLEIGQGANVDVEMLGPVPDDVRSAVVIGVGMKRDEGGADPQRRDEPRVVSAPRARLPEWV